jgi:hypothetical protein
MSVETSENQQLPGRHELLDVANVFFSCVNPENERNKSLIDLSKNKSHKLHN